MDKYGLDQFSDTVLTSVGLLIFFGFFIGVLFWALNKNRKIYYDRVANSLLDDGEKS